MKISLFLLGSLAAAFTTLGATPAQAAGYDGFLPAQGYDEKAGGEGSLESQKLTVLGSAEWNLPKLNVSPLYLYRQTAALTYPAITYPSGGGAQITPTDSTVQEISRKLGKGLSMKDNPVIYASFLMRVSEKRSSGTAYVLFNSVGGLGAGISDGSLMILSRQQIMNDEGKMEKKWVPEACQQYNSNTTYYFIVKISGGPNGWDGEDEMSLWINPKDVSTEDKAGSGALFHNADQLGDLAAPSGYIGHVILHTEDLKGATVTFDELWVGPTWESVTGPVAP